MLRKKSRVMHVPPDQTIGARDENVQALMQHSNWQNNPHLTDNINNNKVSALGDLDNELVI